MTTIRELSPLDRLLSDAHRTALVDGPTEYLLWQTLVGAWPITGSRLEDYLLKAVVPDMEYYERFLLGKLTRIAGVTGVHSSFELRRVIQRTALPLEHISDATVL